MRSDSNACQTMLHTGERHPKPERSGKYTFDYKWEEQIHTVSQCMQRSVRVKKWECSLYLSRIWLSNPIVEISAFVRHLQHLTLKI